jgi:hypothetical protein
VTFANITQHDMVWVVLILAALVLVLVLAGKR